MTVKAFQIHGTDNVATALEQLAPGVVRIHGDTITPAVEAVTGVPSGHKISLTDIGEGTPVIKYGVIIGRSTAFIPMGSWVHLHNMCSVYDERSGHLDTRTGVPKDTVYE